MTIILILNFLCVFGLSGNAETSKKYVIDENSSYYVTNETWSSPLMGGDTIFVLSSRTKPLIFKNINGSLNNPVTVINSGGQVVIEGPQTWGAISFENCTNIKISGNGDPDYKYGFKLSAQTCGLAFTELSSNCEAEFIKIDFDGFVGILAKKDYGGNPPSPAPVFSDLVIHDCFIQNVSEGMYLGETKSPGMEFRHLKIYNNIVVNTRRESIQIANMVEDVEIYNNTLLNAGRDGEIYQSNILQIGDNSVAKVYNNILIGAPSFGVICLGKGDISITNNFISTCKGIFTDNRKFTEAYSPIEIAENYFDNIISEEVIKNMNELIFFKIIRNSYSSAITFFRNLSGNENNINIVGNQNISIAPIAFTSPGENDYSQAKSNSVIYTDLGAPGGREYLTKKESTVNKTPEQIILNAGMLVDEVTGGSYWSADYLVDEQYCTPENSSHPVSQSWKPYWNMNLGHYHVYIDLQAMHHISNISFHDMHNTKNLEISIGEPGNWHSLFVEPCEKYNTWKQHKVNVSTRYIRLSMTESVYAAINEVVFYGYSEDNLTLEKSGNIKSLAVSAFNIEQDKNQIRLVQNPVTDNLGLILPEILRKNFSLDLFDMNGKKILTKNYNNYTQSKLRIDISAINMKNGIYFIQYSNTKGVSETLKFTKSSF